MASTAWICGSSTKTFRSPAWVKSTWVVRNVALSIRLSLLGRHVGERHGKQGAADAIADGGDLLLAGRLLDRVERREDAFAHVMLEALLRMPLVRVDPRDAEHRQALRDRPADEAFLRVEIEHVVLVDPGRHDQERSLQHLCPSSARIG